MTTRIYLILLLLVSCGGPPECDMTKLPNVRPCTMHGSCRRDVIYVDGAYCEILTGGSR